VVRLFGHPDAKDERACEQDASAAKYRSCPVHPSRSFHGRAVADVHRTSIAEEGTPEQCVVTLSTEQRVVPEVAGEVVVAIPTVYDVITGTAEQIVVALVAGDVVGAGLTRRKVVARTALDHVAAVLASEPVVTGTTDDDVDSAGGVVGR
jgi:hypothetical protein